MTLTIDRDVVVDHSADPDYWSVYTRQSDGSLRYTHTLSTDQVRHLRDVDNVTVTNRAGQSWDVR